MRKTPPDKAPRLSELEGAVLGLIWRSGPITAHSIRRTFLASPTDHFSGSAGAIYPLIRRVSSAGLIAPSPTAAGAKGGVAYSLTPPGRKALEAWLTPDDSWLAGVTFDPLRSRVLVLGLLGKRRRAQFLKQTERRLADDFAKEAVVLDTGCQDEWVAAARRGALAVMRARLRWIRELRSADQRR